VSGLALCCTISTSRVIWSTCRHNGGLCQNDFDKIGL